VSGPVVWCLDCGGKHEMGRCRLASQAEQREPATPGDDQEEVR
jgi:hypothetical protein